MNRAEIFAIVQKKLESDLSEIELSLSTLIHDLSNETKSSAGDKYETAREMIQQERQQLETAKQLKRQQLTQMIRLSENKVSKTAEAGSLIVTTNGIFLLGVPIGKIELTTKSFLFALGLQSPLSQQLLGKTVGNQVQLNGISYQITELC